MVVGLDVWPAHFKDFDDRYVLVGGVACDLLMVDAGLDFRATKDFDVVLLVEVLDAAFAEDFWAFVADGGYALKARGEGGRFYRFAKPETAGYPYMTELFSRTPDGFHLKAGSHLTPLANRRDGRQPVGHTARRGRLRLAQGKPARPDRTAVVA